MQAWRLAQALESSSCAFWTTEAWSTGAVVGLQLVYKGTTWQGLRGRVWKLQLGLLKEESSWHQPCFFSWEGANGKHVLAGTLPFECQG